MEMEVQVRPQRCQFTADWVDAGLLATTDPDKILEHSGAGLDMHKHLCVERLTMQILPFTTYVSNLHQSQRRNICKTLVCISGFSTYLMTPKT